MDTADTMAAFDLSDEDWDATPRAVKAALRKAAAAPDLLEAVKAALVYLGTDATDDSQEAKTLRSVLAKAIAMATGSHG